MRMSCQIHGPVALRSGNSPPPVKHRVGPTANQNSWDKNKRVVLSRIKQRFLGSPACGLVTMNISFPNLCVGFVMCGYFGNMCTCIYCIFVWFRLCIFILFMFLFNFVSFLLLCLCIFIVMYFLFCIFCFHRASWHSSATLTEVFPCFSLSC
jgi:hypothetical protein